MKLLVDFNNVGYSRKNEWVDITDDVFEITGSKEKSGKQIGSVTSDIATFTVDNIDKKFSNDNRKSPLYGKIKPNLKFRLLTGFKGEELIPYASGYIEKFYPSWRDKRIAIKVTDYFKLFKEKEPPEESFQSVSWDELVNILCDHVGLPDFIVRHIPVTEFHYSYFKFEEENCFDALISLMEIAVGEAYFEQDEFYVKTKLALDYQLDTTVDHEITTDDLFDFEENVDGQNIINSIEISAQYKAIAPLDVIFETPDNIAKVENELIMYDGSGSIFVNQNNLPIIHKEDIPMQLINITQRKNIRTNGHVPSTGRIEIHPDSLKDVAVGDTLSLSYSYQQLALLAGKTRKYTFVLSEEIDSITSLDISIWDENGSAKRIFSDKPDVPNTVSKQAMTFDRKTNTVTLTLKNNYTSPVVISTLQLSGYPIRVLSPIEIFARDLPSIEEFGKKEVSLQNNYLNNVRLGEKIAQYIIDNNKQDRKRIEIEIAGYPEFSLDDISKVTEESSGTSHSFTNERIDYSFTSDNGWSVKASLLELDKAPWVYESFKGESWEKTNSGKPDDDFLRDINANLIKNGGAELYTGFSDYNDVGAISQKHIIPDYWRFVRTAGNATSRIRDGGNLVLHGHHSFEITTTNSGTGYYEQIINGIKPNAAYVLSLIANINSSSGKASVLQYADDVLLREDSIDIASTGVYQLMISSLASTNAIVVRIEKLSGTTGVESFVFDKVKFENSQEKTPYIESEETTSVQVGQRYANSLLIGNQYGLEVIDDKNNTRVRIGQYRPNKYGIEVHGGAIEFIGGLPAKQVNIGSETNFENGYDPAAKLEFYYGDVEPESKSVIWVDTSGGKDVWKRWDEVEKIWKSAPIGPQGIQGPAGKDGQSLFTWVKYADDDQGNGMSEFPNGKKYIGLAYNKTVATESSKPSDYTWSLIQGEQGIRGPSGENGQTLYTWLKYADTPTTGMSDSPTGKAYMGIAYNKATPTESTNYADYTWSLIKGEQGNQGVQGPAGKDGQSLFTWVKYADNISGGGMSDSPVGKTYIGLAYNKTTATESSNAADYTWSLIKGDQGATGPKGADGTTTYTWIKYADDASGNGMSDSPNGKRYLGLAYNKTTPTKSSNKADYSWSPLYDNVKVGGRNLIIRANELTDMMVDTNGTFSALVGSNLMADYIPVTAGESLMFSQTFSGDGDNYFRYAFYGADQITLIKRDTRNTEEFQVIVPAGAVWMRVSYDGDNQVQVERGNIVSGWTPAPEDIDKQINDSAESLTEEYNAAIEAKADEINISVSQMLVDSEGNMKEYIGTQVQATEDSFSVRFSEIDATTEQHESDIAEMHSYFRFDPSGLNIGKSDSPLQINISNEQMDFIDNGSVVAYVNGQKMYIDSLEVLTNLIVGNHKIEKYNSEITLIKWVGE